MRVSIWRILSLLVTTCWGVTAVAGVPIHLFVFSNANPKASGSWNEASNQGTPDVVRHSRSKGVEEKEEKGALPPSPEVVSLQIPDDSSSADISSSDVSKNNSSVETIRDYYLSNFQEEHTPLNGTRSVVVSSDNTGSSVVGEGAGAVKSLQEEGDLTVEDFHPGKKDAAGTTTTPATPQCVEVDPTPGSSVLTFSCPVPASLVQLSNEITKEVPISLRIERVDGVLNLSVLGKFNLFSLSVVHANLTAFTFDLEDNDVEETVKHNPKAATTTPTSILGSASKRHSTPTSALSLLTTSKPDATTQPTSLPPSVSISLPISFPTTATIATSPATALQAILNARKKRVVGSRVPQFRSLVDLDLSGNPDLEARTLDGLGSFDALKSLKLRASALGSLEGYLRHLLHKMLALEVLDISSTGLTELRTSTFLYNQHLKKLDTSNNKIDRVGFYEEVIQGLQFLNISGCGLQKVLVVKSPRDQKFLYSNTPSRLLKTLDVSHNHLTSLPAALVYALARERASVNFTGNPWSRGCNQCSMYHVWHYTRDVKDMMALKETQTDLVGAEDMACFTFDALSRCGWDECPIGCSCNELLKITDCSHKELTEMPVVGPSSTETLILSNNSLETLADLASPSWCNLRVVDADNNYIQNLLPAGARGNCSCYNNEDFSFIAHQCFPQGLQRLSLRNNRITRLQASDCSMLLPIQELYLTSNQVQMAGAQACGYLPHLSMLDLSHNSIVKMDEPDFASYPNLRHITLSHNMLNTLSRRTTDLMPHLKILDVSHNQLQVIDGILTGPRTPFSSPLEASVLEKLFLHNNLLHQIAPVLNYTRISKLKKLTLHHNPWTCGCEDLHRLKNRVWRDLDPLLSEAVKEMRCDSPTLMKGSVINNSTVEELCPKNASDTALMSLVATIIIVLVIIWIGFSALSRRRICGMRFDFNSRDETVGRKYDVFVVHSSRDREFVRNNVITPLIQRGYAVAWHENAFRPGAWILENVEKAVRNSRRMLVVASDNLTQSRWCPKEIRRGRHEEFDTPGYKIMALVTPCLPTALPRQVYEVVALRTHVLFSDRDYIEKICNFLPTPNPHENHSTTEWTETNIRRQLELVEQMRLQLEAHQQRTRPTNASEIFHVRTDSKHITINVDSAVASTEPDSNEPKTMTQIERESRMKMLQRFTVSPCSLPARINDDTRSLNYVLVEEENEEKDRQDEESIELEERAFTRLTTTTMSWRF